MLIPLNSQAQFFFALLFILRWPNCPSHIIIIINWAQVVPIKIVYDCWSISPAQYLRNMHIQPSKWPISTRRITANSVAQRHVCIPCNGEPPAHASRPWNWSHYITIPATMCNVFILPNVPRSACALRFSFIICKMAFEPATGLPQSPFRQNLINQIIFRIEMKSMAVTQAVIVDNGIMHIVLASARAWASVVIQISHR